jgi:outer membrane protein assembly factor BamB
MRWVRRLATVHLAKVRQPAPQPVPRGRRTLRRVRAVVVGLVLLAGIGYRVLAPHDMLTRPTSAYPNVVLITDERPYSELRAAPLVVEERLRVYAEKWRVWADAPVGERYESTPYWAFRRWPAELIGVVTASSAQGPVVVSQWSDGALVAIDARLGAIRWRSTGPAVTGGYDGRRTGASVVYEPRALLTGRLGQRTVVLANGTHEVQAFDAATGARLWQRELDCPTRAWTGAALLVLPGCRSSTLTLVGVGDGRDRGTWNPPDSNPPDSAIAAPNLCSLGRSECRLVTVGSKAWLLHSDGSVDGVPALEPGAVLAGDRVIYPTATGVAARRLTDGVALWTWNGTGHLIAADAIGVYLMTDDRTVLGLSPVTGHLTVLGCASSKPNEGWQIGHIHPTDGSYLALERITNVSPTLPDRQYYYGQFPVALVELYSPTRLPVWPGKFAACRPV